MVRQTLSSETFSCMSPAFVSGSSGKTLLLLLSWGDGAQGPLGPSAAERRGCLWTQ